MYNRYVPQPDGSYRKNRVPEPGRPQIQQRPPAPPKQKQEASTQPVCEAPLPCPPAHTEQSPRPCPRKAQSTQDSISSFFKQLLPKDLDTADLLIIILLLLMAGDREEDRSNALLTLALYFFL